MATITKLTEQYLASHPSIRDCLKKRIINYSQLARLIRKELKNKRITMEAILIACRRYSHKIQKEKSDEEAIIRVLKGSELEIKNKIVVVIIDKEIYIDNLMDIEKKIRKKTDTFYAIEGTTSFTLIITEKYLDDVKKLFEHDIIKVTTDLALIILKSPRTLEHTRGVMGYLASLFSEHNVNIYETISCWTDTIFVVGENDVANVMGFLKF